MQQILEMSKLFQAYYTGLHFLTGVHLEPHSRCCQLDCQLIKWYIYQECTVQKGVTSAYTICTQECKHMYHLCLLTHRRLSKKC